MAVGTQGSGGLLGQVGRLDSQGVSVTVATEIGGVAGDTLTTGGFAGGAAGQGAVKCAVTGGAAWAIMGLADADEWCRGGHMAGYAVDHGRGGCGVDHDGCGMVVSMAVEVGAMTGLAVGAGGLASGAA